jgi:hypothetical protein
MNQELRSSRSFPSKQPFGDLDPVIERADSKPSLTDFSPIRANDSDTYEKNSTLTKEEIASKLNKLLMKGLSVSVPQGVNFFYRSGENLDSFLSPQRNRSFSARYR